MRNFQNIRHLCNENLAAEQCEERLKELEFSQVYFNTIQLSQLLWQEGENGNIKPKQSRFLAATVLVRGTVTNSAASLTIDLMAK